MKTKNDYFYPLPVSNLISRYASSFESLRKGNSATLWAFPLSCEFAYLKFVFSQKTLLKKLFPVNRGKHLFLFLDFDSLPEITTVSFHKHLLNQLYTLITKELDKSPDPLKSLLDETPSLIRLNDPYICFQQCIKLITTLFNETTIKITFVVYDNFLERWDEAWGRNLFRLWHIHRKHPDVRLSIFFITKPYLTPEYLPPFLKALRVSYFENISHFPLFDQKETFYTLERSEQVYGPKISEGLRNEIWQSFGGYDEFYFPILQIVNQYPTAIDPQKYRKAWFTNDTILYHCKFLYDSLPPKEQKLLKNCAVHNLQIPKDSLLNKLGLKTIPLVFKHYFSEEKYSSSKVVKNAIGLPDKLLLNEKLTANEYSLLSFFVKNANKDISRDDLANILWGNNVESFSEWALDKLISRLRSKIATPTSLNPIMTIRNKGYKFIL